MGTVFGQFKLAAHLRLKPQCIKFVCLSYTMCVIHLNCVV